jgi:hypothetical protein
MPISSFQRRHMLMLCAGSVRNADAYVHFMQVEKGKGKTVQSLRMVNYHTPMIIATSIAIAPM